MRRPYPDYRVLMAVQVSVNGVSFTTDGTIFQYYRSPKITRITPFLCRPPLPRLRIDGHHITATDTLLVRFLEEQDEQNSEQQPDTLAGNNNDNGNAPLSSCPPRVFVVPGWIESEQVVTGHEDDTDYPIYEERSFIMCDAPPLLQQQQQQQLPGHNDKLPFIARVSVAPNGATFDIGENEEAEEEGEEGEEGEGIHPVRFVAHDPHADLCLPVAVPVPVMPPASATSPVPTPSAAPANGRKETAPTEDCRSNGSTRGIEGTRITVTGRNLYRGSDLAARLRFGGHPENVVPLDEITFDRATSSITGTLPTIATELVGTAAGRARDATTAVAVVPNATPCLKQPAARRVVVEVSVDGEEYFAVPERLTLYRESPLTLQGDGYFPVAGGGEGCLAELVPAQPVFRGDRAKVRTPTL